MKVQYFGDVNDYRKYILLRRVASALRLGVCWMLTPDDGRSDGAKRKYLQEPAKWRSLDPDLFDFLQKVREPPTSDCFDSLERHGIVPEAVFHSQKVPQDVSGRGRFHNACRASFADREIVFFDPDNGLDVKSHPIGGAMAHKFVFCDELRAYYDDGKSILVYQHFPRVQRDVFIAATMERIAAEFDKSKISVVRTPHVAFFAVIRPEHRNAFSMIDLSML